MRIIIGLRRNASIKFRWSFKDQADRNISLHNWECLLVFLPKLWKERPKSCFVIPGAFWDRFHCWRDTRLFFDPTIEFALWSNPVLKLRHADCNAFICYTCCEFGSCRLLLPRRQASFKFQLLFLFKFQYDWFHIARTSVNIRRIMLFAQIINIFTNNSNVRRWYGSIDCFLISADHSEHSYPIHFNSKNSLTLLADRRCSSRSIFLLIMKDLRF